MSQFSVIEIAELYGLNRQTVYKRIAKGELSKNSDGKIDLAEAIRVFGEPAKAQQFQNTEQQSSGENVELLKFKLEALEKQLRLSEEQIREAKERERIALERESFYQNQLESMQRLLEAPKPTVEPSEPEQVQTHTQEPEKAETNEIVVNEVHKDESSAVADETPKEQPKKKGFWSFLG